ncbi:MAG: SusC/RagA family TonB-linked outer membrane protein [Dysgonamonadaceae bacterium]
MKYIQTRFILYAMFAFSSSYLGAQTAIENVDSLGETKTPLVQVAYQKVSQSDILGGVSTVNMEELFKKNYSTYSLDNMQGFVGGWNGNTLWAMDDYLVLVDGVPRDASNVLPSEIAQISFLKSASAVVLYGSRGAKGVIYITTKRGGIEPLKIQVRANSGFYVPKSYPKYLGSAEYMTLYNEARTNDGLSTLYSDDDIYNYASGTNPYRYPNVDMYSSEYLKKAYNRSDVVAEFSGGTQRARFYTNIGFYNQNDLFKFGEAKNNNVSRLNVRGNIDLSLNNYITAWVNANISFYDTRSAIGDYWGATSTLRPNRVSPLIPLSYLEGNDVNSWTLVNNSLNIIDGKYLLGGTLIDQTNIFSEYYAAGKSTWTSRQFQFDTGANIDLANFLKGLSFNTRFAVDYSTSYTTSYNNSYAVFEPSWTNYNGTDMIAGLTKYGTDKKSGVQNISGSSDRQTIAFSGQFNYKNKIGENHNVSAILLASGYQRTQSEVYHSTTNANLGLQLAYNYAHRYYAELGTALVHTAKLAEGHRNGISPSLTLGWRLSKENFLANSSIVDDMMLSASASSLKEDMDISDYYMYEANYTQANGAWWGWRDGASEHSTNSLRGSNHDLTFIKRNELSATLRTSLLKQLITADISFFTNTMEGLIIIPSTLYPSYFSTYYPSASFIPYINYNNNRRTGFDLNAKVNKSVGEVGLSLGVSATYYTSKATQRNENYQYSYQNRQGKPIDGLWGLQSKGFYTDNADIAASPSSSYGTVKPGDIKYIDQNNDGVIDSKDQVYLGKGGWYGTPLTLGLNFTAKWNQFTFFTLWTANYGGKAFKNNTYWWVYGDRKYSEVVRGRWTEATKDVATYPRLTTQSSDNNFQNSDFWIYKTDRINLARVQVTYDFPKTILKSSFIHGLTAYVSGSSLLTLAKERKILEMNVASAPQTRFYNLGIKATF